MTAQRVLPMLVAVATIAGCSPESRQRVLVLLFDEQAIEAARVVPVVRSPRRPPPPTPTATVLPQVAYAGSTALRTWDDVMRLLPKDQVGNPDWGRALEEQVIVPRPGIGPTAVNADVVALDVQIVSRSDPAFNVTFSHEAHGKWLACDNCHPDRFAMQGGATSMSPEQVHSGGSCAACHGTVAFDIVSGCPLCHLRTFPTDAHGRVDWSRAIAEQRIAPRPGRTTKAADHPRLDLDVELTSKTQPTITSVFSHGTHTQWLACANCHPYPFPTDAKTADVPAADLHSRRYCGACHGPVAFGISHNCERCHPMLGKTRQHQQVFDLDVEVAPQPLLSSKTIFSHTTHRFVECPSCHTDLFPPTGAPAKMTMADLAGGKYCATCHGKVAVDLIAQCQRCHSALGDSQ